MVKQSTREVLLAAALEVFAESGYEGATTRQITEKAHANIAAIPYYFSGKEGLYRATLGIIVERVGEKIRPESEILRHKLDSSELTPGESQELLLNFLRHMIGLFFSDLVSPSMVQLFLREQQQPTPAFEELYETLLKKIHETFTELFARNAGIPFPSEEATLGAHAVMGQIFVFKTHQELIRRRLGWESYTPEHVEKMRETILFQIMAILEAYRRKNHV